MHAATPWLPPPFIRIKTTFVPPIPEALRSLFFPLPESEVYLSLGEKVGKKGAHTSPDSVWQYPVPDASSEEAR